SRKPRFTEDELFALTTTYAEKKSILVGKQSPILSNNMKEQAWDTICSAVNAIGGFNRSVEDVKKKILNLRSGTKGILGYNKREISKTGGGPMSQITLTEPQEILSQTFTSTELFGIDGGFDSSEVKPMSIIIHPDPPIIYSQSAASPLSVPSPQSVLSSQSVASPPIVSRQSSAGS